MKKALIVLLSVLVITLALGLPAAASGSGDKFFFNNQTRPDPTTPSGMVELILAFFQTMDMSLIEPYITDGADRNSIEEFLDENGGELELFANITRGMTYEMGEEVLFGNRATIAVSITTFDGRELLENMLHAAVAFLLRGGTTDEIDTYLWEYFKSVDTSGFSRETINLTLELYRDDTGYWSIENDDDLYSAILGNIDKTIEELNW